MKRTDVIVDYKGEQFILEYLDFYHKDRGYLLSFNFNKKKQCGIQEIVYRGKTIVEVVD